MSLLQRVRTYAARHDMWRPSTRVVAAVSGGSDSVAMLRILHELQGRGELRLACVAHLNHQIRPEADEDEAFCRALAERLGVAFVAARVDVPARAKAHRQSVELAGRVARRLFLEDTLRNVGADVIATAHTEDDQAETVLLRLIRGTGRRGLAGMNACANHRVRPVLCASREDLRHYLETCHETWREDASNANLVHTRNRVRHELLPYLQRHFNPSIRHALARLAEVMRDEDLYLERAAVAAEVGMLDNSGPDLSLDGDEFSRLPLAIRRRVLVNALAEAQGRAVSYEDVAQALSRMEHFRGKVVLVSNGGGGKRTDPPRPFSLVLPVPGEVRTDAGWVIEATRFDRPQTTQNRVPRSAVAQIDAATIQGPLMVRNRRPGDRLRPVGLNGSKKLQDVLVDRKVSRGERDAVPIVTDRDDRIVWVAGHVLDAEFRVTERTKGVIILNLRRI